MQIIVFTWFAFFSTDSSLCLSALLCQLDFRSSYSSSASSFEFRLVTAKRLHVNRCSFSSNFTKIKAKKKHHFFAGFFRYFPLIYSVIQSTRCSVAIHISVIIISFTVIRLVVSEPSAFTFHFRFRFVSTVKPGNPNLFRFLDDWFGLCRVPVPLGALVTVQFDRPDPNPLDCCSTYLFNRSHFLPLPLPRLNPSFGAFFHFKKERLLSTCFVSLSV
jgi:hypothetical protein